MDDRDIGEEMVEDSFCGLWEKLSMSGGEIENVKG